MLKRSGQRKPCLGVPDPSRAIKRRSDYSRAVWAEAGRSHCGAMFQQGSYRLSRLGVPNPSDPISGSGDQAVAVRAEFRAINRIAVC